MTITKEETERLARILEGSEAYVFSGAAADHMRALQNRIDELEAKNTMTTAFATALSERMRKIEAALEWVDDSVLFSNWSKSVMLTKYNEDGSGRVVCASERHDGTVNGKIDALTALHGRTGK